MASPKSVGRQRGGFANSDDRCATCAAMVSFLYLMQFAFEFDSEKSAANKAKHGIDFAEAQEIWTDAEP